MAKNNNPAFKWIVPVSLAVLLIIGLVWSAPFLRNREKSFTSPQSLLEKASTLRTLAPDMQKEVVGAIIKTGDIAKCESAQGIVIDGVDYYAVCRDNVAYETALRTEDASLCDQISSNLDPERCRQEVVANKVRASGDVALCSSLEKTGQESCRLTYWLGVAQKNNDAGQCENLQEENLVEECSERYLIGVLLNDPSTFVCSRFSSNQLRSDCETYKTVSKNPTARNSGCEVRNEQLSRACLQLLH